MLQSSDFDEITLLDQIHDRASFSCGDEKYDRYLREIVKQDIKRSVAACWVLTFASSKEIIGYYTLSNCGLTLPPEEQKKVTRYQQVPASLIGKLASSQKAEHKGLRIGEHLLLDALFRSLEYSKRMASWGVIVDSEPTSISFYEKYGFIRLVDSPNRLVLEMNRIEKLFPEPVLDSEDLEYSGQQG